MLWRRLEQSAGQGPRLEPTFPRGIVDADGAGDVGIQATGGAVNAVWRLNLRTGMDGPGHCPLWYNILFINPP